MNFVKCLLTLKQLKPEKQSAGEKHPCFKRFHCRPRTGCDVMRAVATECMGAVCRKKQTSHTLLCPVEPVNFFAQERRGSLFNSI